MTTTLRAVMKQMIEDEGLLVLIEDPNPRAIGEAILAHALKHVMGVAAVGVCPSCQHYEWPRIAE